MGRTYSRTRAQNAVMAAANEQFTRIDAEYNRHYELIRAIRDYSKSSYTIPSWTTESAVASRNPSVPTVMDAYMNCAVCRRSRTDGKYAHSAVTAVSFSRMFSRRAVELSTLTKSRTRGDTIFSLKDKGQWQ